MGRGIARRFAAAGAQVAVLDADVDATARGAALTVEEAERDGAPVEVEPAAGLEALVADVDVLIEAVLEDLALKTELLSTIGALASERLVVATNTSSLSVDSLGQAYGRPDRLLGLHFFNPPTRMRLVEVVAGTRTAPEVVREAMAWVEQLGQVPVRCIDTPNFVVNRVCRPLYHESAMLVSAGVPAAAVDAVARAALGHRLGPLELVDRIGLHTHLVSSESAYAELADARYAPVPLVRRLVRAGALGLRTGRGFYDYSDGRKPREAQADVVQTAAPESGASESVGIEVVGAGAARLAGLARSGAEPVTVVSDGGGLDDEHESLVSGLVAEGRAVVVDSSDAAWLPRLPDAAGWVRLHHRGDAWFAERVVDEVASRPAPPTTDVLLRACEATYVDVPAVPGLVADRLADCLVNEATWVVQEGVATPGDVDVALRLGMNHPQGPFELLDRAGSRTVLRRLCAMQAVSGDARYRPSALLRRMAAGTR
jgi:3-hydroxybutyryl-CoA dehydrogenase